MPARLKVSRRGTLRAAGVIGAALCAAACGEVHARLTLGPARPVTVAVAGPPSALYAPLYAAAADGDFRDGALSVRVVAAPAGDALAALQSGRATIAVTSEPQLLAARDSGAQVVAIGALVGRPLDAIVSLARRPVGAGAQLAGATVAITGTALARAELASVLAAAHVPARRVRAVAAPPGLTSALTTRRAIATLGGPWPFEVVTLVRGRHHPRVLALTAAGVPSYSGLVLAVRTGEAHHDGPLLRAFLQSLGRGARAVAADPGAAAATLAQADPVIGAQIERAALAQLAPIVAAPTATSPFGYQAQLAWRAFGAWMAAHGLLRHRADGAAAVTDEFLPGQGA